MLYIFVLVPFGPVWGGHWIPCFTPLCLPSHPIGAILREHLSHSGPSWPFALACWSLLVLELAATFASPGINSFHSRKNSPSDDTIMLGPHKSCKLRVSCRLPEKCFFFKACALGASYADTNWVQSAFFFNKLLFSERTVLGHHDKNLSLNIWFCVHKIGAMQE